MKILYISHLSTNIAAGPNWSVPASVDAQSKIDNVLWVNMTDVVMNHWKEVDVYHNITEYDGRLNTLNCLPKPFNRPDVVVFEGFYYMDDVRIARMLKKQEIPYVIIPRGSLTKLSLHNHAWLKKWIAHKIFFNKFINHAWRIQYLTKQEADDSIKLFKTPYFIVPNGFDTPSVTKTSYCSKGIKALFIGRLDIYHKGLDLLLDAITEVHTELRDAGFFLNIYGPHRYDYEKIKSEIEKRGITEIASVNDEISGKEKEQAILDSDLFIMTSRFEGHPMGLIEVLAYGLPCIVTPGTNMLEEVKYADAGWGCEGNVESIKEALLNAVADKESYEIKSQHAKELASRYNWDKLAEDFHKKLMALNNI